MAVGSYLRSSRKRLYHKRTTPLTGSIKNNAFLSKVKSKVKMALIGFGWQLTQQQ
jgi:hypothetical protein